MISLTVIFYSICVVSSICGVPYEISICYPAVMGGVLVRKIIIGLHHFAYVSHWIAMLTLFFFRLKMSLESTAFQLGKYHQYIFMAVICVIIGLFGIAEFGIMTQSLPLSAIGVIGAVMVLVMAIYAQILIILLVRGLYIVNTHSQVDQQLVSIMVRQIILVTVSFLSSTFFVVVCILSGFGVIQDSQVGWWQLAASSAISLDILVDVFCISLGLKICDRVYYLLCGPLDRCVKSWSPRDVIKRGRRKKLELELAVSAALSIQQNAGDETIEDVPNKKAVPFCE